MENAKNPSIFQKFETVPFFGLPGNVKLNFIIHETTLSI